jgi:hypothetical protein
MKRFSILLGLLILVSAITFADDPKQVNATGQLIDNACGLKHANEPGNAERIAGHSTSCALMDACQESGYGVLIDGKYYKLDEAGNTAAVAVLKATKVKKGVKVKVEGTISGDTLKVTKLTEAE